jgi:FkbM family methyltransferase
MIKISDAGLNFANETFTKFVYQRVLRIGDHALDVGANHGDHTRVMAQTVGTEGVVHAFEPNFLLIPGLCRVGTNVRVWPLAAADKTGVTTLYVPEGLDGWSSQRTDLKADLPDRTIHARTAVRLPIDQLLGEIIPSKVRFIKIDVEKYEAEALTGMKELLSRSRAIVVFENPTIETNDILGSVGYSVFGFDGLPILNSPLGMPNAVAVPNECVVLKDKCLPDASEISAIIAQALTT